MTVYFTLLSLVGILSYRLIERPFLRMRGNRMLPIGAALKRRRTRSEAEVGFSRSK